MSDEKSGAFAGHTGPCHRDVLIGPPPLTHASGGVKPDADVYTREGFKSVLMEV